MVAWRPMRDTIFLEALNSISIQIISLILFETRLQKGVKFKLYP
jgi:hypothetical protein